MFSKSANRKKSTIRAVLKAKPVDPKTYPGTDSFTVGWVTPLIPFSFPFLLSLFQYMPARKLVPLNAFEITFLGSGVG